MALTAQKIRKRIGFISPPFPCRINDTQKPVFVQDPIG
jgi:hypothetical protein